MFADDRAYHGDALLTSPHADFGSDSFNHASPTSRSETFKAFVRRRKKGIAFVTVFLVLAFAVGVAIVASRPSDEESGGGGCTCCDNPGPPVPPGKLYGFNNVFDSSLTVGYASLSWSPFDDSYITRITGGTIVQVKPNIDGSNFTTVLIDGSKVTDYRSAPYQYDATYQFFLFRANFQSLYRYSGVGTYYLYSVASNIVSPFPDSQQKPLPLQYAAFTPASDIVFVYQNNLYYYNVSAGQSVAVTNDGQYNAIINGICDWAYEEEVYGHSEAVWPNPTGSYIAFLQFNESAVPEYSFPLFDLPRNAEYRYKYPKVGDTNSLVSLGIYRAGDSSATFIDLQGASVDQYVINVLWLSDTRVGIKIMPRLQSSYKFYAIDISKYPAYTMTPLHSAKDDWYIDTDFSLRALNDSHYIDIGSINDRQHIALYNSGTGALVKWLTSAPDWNVVGVNCYDSQLSLLYFTSTYQSSIDRSLHSVNVNSGEIRPVVGWDSSSSVWQSASFSAHCHFLTLSERATALNTRLFAIDRNSSDGKAVQLSVMRDNANVLKNIDTYTLPKRVLTTFPSRVYPAESLNAYFLLPPGYQGDLSSRDCSYQYPVIINPYGGPGSQQVTSQFARGGNGGTGYTTYLSSSLGFIVLVVDPIGTGYKSNTFQKNFTTKQLTLNEEVDLMAVIESLKDYCFVDSGRIAYWGHSYGGTMATRVATSNLSESVRVNTVIAGAPVTDWRLYDSIYTERYMRQLTNNGDGYNRTSLLYDRAKNLTVPHYYLFHGTADDNVHYQNAALLAQSLTGNMAQFQQFNFINRNHGFRPFNGYGNSAFSNGPSLQYYSMLTNIFEGMVHRPVTEVFSVGSRAMLASSLQPSHVPVSHVPFDLDALAAHWSQQDEATVIERLGELA